MPKTMNEFAAELESVEEGSAMEFFEEYARQHRHMPTMSSFGMRGGLSTMIVNGCLSWAAARRGPDYWTMVCQKLRSKEIKEGRRPQR